jgi:hypothetical protein
MIGLSWYGLLVFNGTVHVAGTIAAGATGVLAIDVIVIITPLLIGWIGSKLLRPITPNAPRAAAA